MTFASPRTTVGNDDPISTTTTTAIDFRELRRSMRRARASASSSAKGRGGDGKDENIDDGATTTTTSLGAPAAAAEKHDDVVAVKYGGGNGDTLLPPVLDDSWSSSSASTPSDDDNVLARYRVGEVDHVHYVSRFLGPHYTNDVLLPWLQSLPDVIDDHDDERNNMRWKTLRHARRRVMMVDATTAGDPGNMKTDGGGGAMPEVLSRIVDALVETGFFSSSTTTTGSPRPNHVLVNEYRPGEGILPHTDGPAYHPRTATISISVGGEGDGGCEGEGDDDGSTSANNSTVVTGTLFKFRPRLSADEIGGAGIDGGDGSRSDDDGVVMEVLLEGHGSLVVFSDDAYTKHCHSIDEVTTEVVTDGICVNCEGGTVVARAGRRISLTFRHKYVPSLERD